MGFTSRQPGEHRQHSRNTWTLWRMPSPERDCMESVHRRAHYRFPTHPLVFSSRPFAARHSFSMVPHNVGNRVWGCGRLIPSLGIEYCIPYLRVATLYWIGLNVFRHSRVSTIA